MEKARLAFTKKGLQSLPVPERGRVYHYDKKSPGLCACVTSTGATTFYFYRRAKGRPVRVRIGRFPDVTVETARKQAAALNAAVARGEDPQASRQAARQCPTVGDLFAFWLETHARVHKRTWREDQAFYDQFLRPWRNRKLEDVHKTDVQALHARVGRENGRYRANRLLELVRAMFNKAPDMGYEGPNPATGIKKFREQSRDRYLQADELPRFFEAVRSEPNETLRDFFYLCVFTGARRANVLAMRWEAISLELGVWRIPETKSGQAVLVPLSEPALAVLRRRAEGRGDCPWVLPAITRKSRTGHLGEPKFAWRRICERAGLDGIRIHDLRRTLGSWQVATGASLPIIARSLGHLEGSKATAVYTRLSLGPVRESVEKATIAMLTAAGVLQVEGPKDE